MGKLRYKQGQHEGKRVRGVYGRQWSNSVGVEVTEELLAKLAKCMIDTIVEEGKKDFAKRGWKLGDPMKGPPFHESWTFKVVGEATIEIRSSYYGMKELTSGDIPSRRMTWLTQEYKDQHPTRFHLTPGEKKRGMNKAGRHSKGERLPLIIPIEKDDGTVLFRYAPLTAGDAWIHPGIAKFTFMQRAIRKGRERCKQILASEIVKYLVAADPTK